MKIIVASFQCESNSKARLHPKIEDFEYFKGEKIFDKLAVKEVFENAGYEVVPSIYAVALPSATVTEDVYFHFEKQIEQTVKENSDAVGVYIFFHGSMEVDNIGSGELYLVKRIRGIVSNYCLIDSPAAERNQQRRGRVVPDLLNRVLMAAHGGVDQHGGHLCERPAVDFCRFGNETCRRTAGEGVPFQKAGRAVFPHDEVHPQNIPAAGSDVELAGKFSGFFEDFRRERYRRAEIFRMTVVVDIFCIPVVETVRGTDLNDRENFAVNDRNGYFNSPDELFHQNFIGKSKFFFCGTLPLFGGVHFDDADGRTFKRHFQNQRKFQIFGNGFVLPGDDRPR